MALVLKDLFETMKDFQECIPGVDSNVSFSLLNASASSARKDIINILTAPIYQKLREADGEPRELLQMALGNNTMAKENPHDVLRRRKANVDIYRHELEAMQRSYIDNYYNAMDSLICYLDSGDREWKRTPYYQLRDRLQITSTEEFNLLYPIDNSYLFFFRTIPVQCEILDETISDYFIRIQNRPEYKDRLKRALAQLIIAYALQRFDLQELPATIRNHYKDSSLQRHSANEQTILHLLAEQLLNTAHQTLQNIDLAIQEPKSGNIETETSFNRPDDKIYLLG
ncbi:MAG: hypothetical protein LUG98_09455 [Tannerellaceae bacterium]|nr:hypothetical protein [Tannerellaceae bacterium]